MVLGGARQFQRLDVVPLREAVQPLVHGHVARQVQQVRGRGQHRLPYVIRGIGPEVGRHGVHHERGGHGACVATAELVVQFRDALGHGDDHVHFVHADPAGAAGLDRFGTADDIRPPGNREGDGEQAGPQDTAARWVHVPPPEVDQPLHGIRGCHGGAIAGNGQTCLSVRYGPPQTPRVAFSVRAGSRTGSTPQHQPRGPFQP